MLLSRLFLAGFKPQLTSGLKYFRLAFQERLSFNEHDWELNVFNVASDISTLWSWANEREREREICSGEEGLKAATSRHLLCNWNCGNFFRKFLTIKLQLYGIFLHFSCARWKIITNEFEPRNADEKSLKRSHIHVEGNRCELFVGLTKLTRHKAAEKFFVEFSCWNNWFETTPQPSSKHTWENQMELFKSSKSRAMNIDRFRIVG